MAQEIELKLAFPPAARAAILAHPLLAHAEQVGRPQDLRNTYYDTPDLALSAQRVALRTRKAGQRWLQTVKCAAASLGGLSSRPEWEQAFSGQFDFSAIEAEAPRRLLEAHRAAIVPLFTTDFHRTTFALSPRPGVRVLAMLDSGEISANGRREAISELELELVSGTPDELFAIAGALAADLPLLPYDPSKAARGYRLFRNEPARPARAAPPHLDLQTPAGQAFRDEALRAIADWAANQHGVLSSAEPEYLHQLRLALRRLRNLLGIFAALLPADFVSHWQTVLRAEAAALAEARALHALSADILQAAREGDRDARLPDLLAYAQSQAEAACDAVRERLGAPGAAAPLLALTRALHALPAPAHTPTLATLAATSQTTLLRQSRHRFKRAASEHSPEALHALRIACKRLRQASDLFAPRFHTKAHARLRAELADCQAELGHLHDLAEAMPRLTAWAAADPGLREAVAFVAGWHAATSLQSRQTILPRCARLLRKKRWPNP